MAVHSKVVLIRRRKTSENSHRIHRKPKQPESWWEDQYNERNLTSTFRQKGLSRRKAKHMRWHCYRHPQASQWLTANTANELSHLPPLLYSPSLFYFALAFSTEERASVFSSASQYFIRLPPTLPFHFRNGCGNTSTEHTDSFQPAKKSRRHTSNNSLVQLTQTLNQISV